MIIEQPTLIYMTATILLAALSAVFSVVQSASSVATVKGNAKGNGC